MARSLFLVFNHAFTAAQEQDARSSLRVSRVLEPPGHLQALWSDVPPDLQEIREYLEPVMEWLGTNAAPGDYVLVQGDFGACYLLVEFCMGRDLVPVYSNLRGLRQS